MDLVSSNSSKLVLIQGHTHLAVTSSFNYNEGRRLFLLQETADHPSPLLEGDRRSYDQPDTFLPSVMISSCSTSSIILFSDCLPTRTAWLSANWSPGCSTSQQ